MSQANSLPKDNLSNNQSRNGIIDFEGDVPSIFDLAQKRYDKEHNHDGTNSPILEKLIATKTSIGLGNVDNTADADKPISTSAQTALNGKLDIAGNGSQLSGLTKGQVSLGNVDNTSDSTKNSASATLANKTLTKPVVNASVQGISTYTPSAGDTVTLDLSLSNIHNITMPAGNITIALSNVSVGQVFIINITQDGTGSRLATLFNTIRWAGGIAPTLTVTGSKRDCLGFVCQSANNYDGFIVGLNI